METKTFIMKLFASELELRCVEGEIEELEWSLLSSEVTRNLLHVRNTVDFYDYVILKRDDLLEHPVVLMYISEQL